MAKRATPAGTGTTKRKRAAAKPKTAARKPARAAGTERRRTSDRRKSDRRTSDLTAADALFKLIESPLVADLLAVGATAALSAVAESRFSRRDDGHKSSRTVKAAGKAAAAAIGRRLNEEFEAIRDAAKAASESAGETSAT